MVGHSPPGDTWSVMDFSRFDAMAVVLLTCRRPLEPSSSMRCTAGKSEPGFTTKVPPLIGSILRKIPSPCISPVARDFKIGRSSVLVRALQDVELSFGAFD